MKKLVKKPLLLLVIGFILGYITSVIADTINSNEVLYDNSNINSNVDNVQDALDGLYNTVAKVGSGYKLVVGNTTGLSTALIGGLYRYQGIQDENNNVDNYICFGTIDKDTCVENAAVYMYRIIGINTNGQMKLIKKEPLNTQYKWDSNLRVEWPSSELYAGLNGNYYLNNVDYIPDNNWRNRIVYSDWHYYTSEDLDINTITERELNASTVSAKIGLMYLHDYANSLAIPEYSNKSWLHSSSGSDRTITRATDCDPWYIVNSPTRGTNTMRAELWVRPVFFLNSSQTIASGSGTITDPYILS